MKGIFSFLIMMTAVFQADGQSNTVIEIFKLLPADKLFNLSGGTRDSLLAGKTYYPATNDSNQIEAYNYGSSSLIHDYMYITRSYETEQRGTAMIEIRAFKRKKGDWLVLISNTSGVPEVNYQQNDLAAYTYNQTTLLSCKTGLNELIDEKKFIRGDAPDSLKHVIINNSNLVFDLHEQHLQLKLNCPYVLDRPGLKHWLKGDRIGFVWTGTGFKKNKVSF